LLTSVFISSLTPGTFVFVPLIYLVIPPLTLSQTAVTIRSYSFRTILLYLNLFNSISNDTLSTFAPTFHGIPSPTRKNKLQYTSYIPQHTILNQEEQTSVYLLHSHSQNSVPFYASVSLE